MKILVLFGTRPEAIKLAPVVHELQHRPAFEVRVCVTAQHREMLDQVLTVFSLQPDHDLNLMRPNQTLFQITASTLSALEAVLEEEKPGAVIVQGDTTTAMVGALASFYKNIPVGHVEAGLRTGNIYNPFPEEMNRRVADLLSHWFFAPTELSRQNLLAEGVPEGRIHITGNTVIDALQYVAGKQSSRQEQERLAAEFTQRYGFELNSRARLIVVTGHRRESFGQKLENLCLGLRGIAEKNEDVQIVYPVHLNPNVQAPVRKILTGCDRVHLIEPLEYELFVWLLQRSYFVLTDSGGIQEEAPALGKPALVMRKTTERPEGVEAGVSKLVGTDTDKIVSEAQRLLDDEAAYRKMASKVNPYGDGHSAARIADILARD